MSRTQRGPNDRPEFVEAYNAKGPTNFPPRLPETDPDLPQVENEPQAEVPEETNDLQPEIEETDSNV